MIEKEYVALEDICEFIPGAQPPKSEFVHEYKPGSFIVISKEAF